MNSKMLAVDSKLGRALEIIGILLLGAIVVPVAVGIIVSIPDIRRYWKIRQM